MKSQYSFDRSTTHSKKNQQRATLSVGLFSSDDRGQTFFDFVIGITLFLFVLLFTVFFIPGLIDPFQPSQDASTVLADRGADHLTQDVLREQNAGPYILDEQCTVAFFDGRATDSCDVESDELHEIVGMDADVNARIEIVDESGNPIVIHGVELAYGDDINSNGEDVYRATRMVTVNGSLYELNYLVW